MTMKAFGLLHLDESQRSAMNVKVKDFRDQISIYVANAISLSTSLHAQGIPFILLTNDKAFVDDCAAQFKMPLRVEEIPCITDVPRGISFYSAHFKLDAFRYMATLGEGYFALCDLDMLCINAFPECLHNLAQAQIPLCYDISDQRIPVYGHEVILRDLKLMHGLDSEGRWIGGEFIAGPSAFFLALCAEIDRIYPQYIANITSFNHVGDEAFTSAAIELLRRKGLYIADAGTLGIVGRYWSGPLGHPQKPFKYFLRCFIVHLPVDKRFLMGLANRGVITLPEFKRLYFWRRYSLIQRMKKIGHALRRLLRNRLR